MIIPIYRGTKEATTEVVTNKKFASNNRDYDSKIASRVAQNLTNLVYLLEHKTPDLVNRLDVPRERRLGHSLRSWAGSYRWHHSLF